MVRLLLPWLALWMAPAPQAVTATNAAGQSFLTQKSTEHGVITLPSGLMYKVLREGSGDRHPTPASSCSCNYKGTLIDGTEFDSSYRRGQPAEFAPNQVIKGWEEAMRLMVAGDAWEIYVPSELGYGEVGLPPKIKGGDALVFQIELLKIDGDAMPSSRCDPNRENKGCDDQEIKYIEKIASTINGDTGRLKAVLQEIAGAGLKGKKILVKWMKTDLGIRLKNGKLSTKWYNKIKRILSAMATPTVTLEGVPMQKEAEQ